MGWGGVGQQSRLAAPRAAFIQPWPGRKEYHFCLVTRTVESGSGRTRTFWPGSWVLRDRNVVSYVPPLQLFII